MKIPSLKITLKVLLVSFFLFCHLGQSIAQSSIAYTPLKSYSPDDDFDDLTSLDKFFSKSKVVGMGESTHGTREFFLNRHRVFKYLVEKHGFNTFFLEADYANCLRVNRYIHGAEDNLNEVVIGIGLWPWRTEEMAALIEWMREYNASHPATDQLQFIGCDMQMYNSTITEIDRLINRYDPTLVDKSDYIHLTEKEFNKLSVAELIEKYKPLVAQKESLLERIDFEKDDLFAYQTLVKHLDQVIKYKGEKISYWSYRDKMMGENILHHMNHNPSIKAMYWAHNGHVVNYFLPAKRADKGYFSAGGILKDKLQEAYLIIGQDFVNGTLNVYHIPDYDPKQKLDLEDINNFELGPVTAGLKENDLGYQFKDVPEPMLYFRASGLEKKQQLLYMQDYGANYVPQNSKFTSNSVVGSDSYDLIIVIKDTTATRLIPKSE